MIVRREQRQNRRGFTLMEMLVVVAIIVVLAGAGGYYFWQSYSDSRVDVAITQMKGPLQQAVETYQLHNNGQIPSDLSVLLTRTNGKGPYLKKADYLIDPWGQTYQIAAPPQGQVVPKIFTVGPEGNEISNYTGGIQQQN